MAGGKSETIPFSRMKRDFTSVSCHENTEPVRPKSDSNIIFGVNQAHEGFVNPEIVLPLNELGEPVNRKLPKESIVITHYWIKKKKLISALGVISSLSIAAILVQETKIFDTIFLTTTEFIMFGFNYFIGLFL